MKCFPFLILLLILGSCSNKIAESDLHHLNGYWEIEKVVFPEGGSKEYDLNTSLDFIAIENNKGYRKKVQPKPGGGFITSNDAEPLTIVEQNGTFFFQYKNPLSEWREQIEQLTPNSFRVVNEENIRYHYIRYTPKK